MSVTQQFQGVNGIIDLYPHKVVIRRAGLGNKILGMRGDKHIFLKSIGAIQFKESGKLTNGFIQFSFSGGDESKGGTFDAAKDENTVMFKKGQEADAYDILLKVEQFLCFSGQNPPPMPVG